MAKASELLFVTCARVGRKKNKNSRAAFFFFFFWRLSEPAAVCKMPFGDRTFWWFAVHSGWTVVPNKVWMILNRSHRHFCLPYRKSYKKNIKLLNISFRVFELFHKCLRLIQKLKRYPPFVKKKQDLTRSPVEYFIKPCHNFSFICTGKTPKRWNPTMYSAFQTLQIVRGLKQCQERSASLRSYPASVQLPSQLIISPAPKAYPRVITVHLYAATLRLLAAIFWPLSSSEQIPPPVLTDYYILENNSLLKAALKYKRIQLTDFRNVPMEHFGEKKGRSSILLQWITDKWSMKSISFKCDMFFCCFSQIYLWRSPTRRTSLIPVTTDCCCWCT